MSVAEMKLAAINEVIKLKDEKTVREVLEYLEKLNEVTKTTSPVLQHAFNIINQRSSVLEKLAQ